MIPPPISKLSVIIPVWNQRPEMVQVCRSSLEALRDHSGPDLQVILVDNGSAFPLPDDLVTGIFPTSIRLYRTSNSIAGAWNDGIRASCALPQRREFVCLLNDDCRVEKGWWRSLMACAAEGNIAMPWTNGIKSDGVGVVGWCFLFKDNLWTSRVGPFDELFSPCFWEDTDWFHRAWNAGVGLRSCPQSKVLHARRSSAQDHPHMDHIFQAGRFRYAWKHRLADPKDPPTFWRQPLPDWEMLDDSDEVG